MTYLLEVQAPGARAEEHELTLGAVTVGSTEQASLKVATPQLPPWQLSLHVSSATVELRWHGEQPGLVVEGHPQFQATVPWGAEVFAGGVRLSFLATAQAPRKVHPLLVAGLVGGLFWLAWQGGGVAAEASGGPPAEPPALDVPRASCPETDEARARERAVSELVAASAKRDRYPFDATEGLEALQRLELSRACFEVAHDGNGAARARATYEAFQRQLTLDYSSLRLQLDRATEQSRPRQGLAAVKELESLLAPLGDSSYRSWLKSERRRLESSLRK